MANLGASYDFGIAKPFGEFSRVSRKRDYAVAALVALPDADLDAYLVGATVPVGPGLIRAAYSRVKYDRNVATPTGLEGQQAQPQRRAEPFQAHGTVGNRRSRQRQEWAALTVGGPAFISTSVFALRT